MLPAAWEPWPTDLAYVDSFIMAGEVQVDWKRRSTFGVSARSQSPLVIIEDPPLRPPWSRVSRRRADLRARSGALLEAIIWINMATEALLNERFESFKSTTGVDVRALTESAPGYWELAEETLRTQYPYMAGRVEWPPASSYPSLYRILRVAHQSLPLQVDLKDVVRHYNLISAARNSVVHGAVDRVSSVIVTQALEAYDWLDAEFQLLD